MAVPDRWETLRPLFARLALAKGASVPQRYGGEAEELYCFPAISKTIKALGETEFIAILEDIWADNQAARQRVVALAKQYFARLAAGDKLTQAEAKGEWKAATSKPGTKREDPEAAVAWGLAAMLVEE